MADAYQSTKPSTGPLHMLRQERWQVRSQALRWGRQASAPAEGVQLSIRQVQLAVQSRQQASLAQIEAERAPCGYGV